MENVGEFAMHPTDVFPPEVIDSAATLSRDWASVIEAVAMIATSRPGSGVLIAPDRVLTAHHVIPSREVLARAGVRLGVHGKMAGRRLTPLPAGFFRTSEALDYTVFGVEPVRWTPPLDLETAVRPRVGQRVRVLGHRHRNPLEVSGPEDTVQSVKWPYVEYTADTEDGMSGGPVLSSRRRLIAIHHFGDSDRDLSNRGVRATAIRRDLT